MNKALLSVLVVCFIAGVFGPAQAQSSRDYISVVGSSTVYPFSTVVAERFGRGSAYKTPKIESTGTGGGFKLFCSGVGVQHPDVTNASRSIKSSEYNDCVKNGVTDIVEVKVGYDGIVMANSKKTAAMKLTRKEIFMALAKEVPDPKAEGKFIANPYKTWRDVNPSLPNVKIEVLGPPPTSGTRDAFVEMAMLEGANQFAAIKALAKSDKKKHKAVTETVREDGSYIEAGENDNLIVQKLETNPNAVGIFGFSFLDQNIDKIQGAYVDHVQPTFENIADGKYPLSRPLFFYVKGAHVDVIPGIRQYLDEFSSEKAWGKDGYLSEKGLIPMPEGERKQVREAVKNLKKLEPVK